MRLLTKLALIVLFALPAFGQFAGFPSCSASSCPVVVSPNDAMPALNSAYQDNFYKGTAGTATIYRLTKAASERAGQHYPEYSVVGTPTSKYLLVFEDNGSYSLFDAVTRLFIRNITSTNGCAGGAGIFNAGVDISPQGMYTDPSSFIYTCNLKVMKYNADTDQSSIVLDLTGTTIAGVDTSTGGPYLMWTTEACGISKNDRRIGLVLRNNGTGVSNGVFTVDTVTGYLAGHNVVSSTGPDADWFLQASDRRSKTPYACISPSGDYVVVPWNCAPSMTPNGGSNGCPNNGVSVTHAYEEVYNAADFTPVLWGGVQSRFPSQSCSGSNINFNWPPPHSDIGIDVNNEDAAFSRFYTCPSSTDSDTYQAVRLRDGNVYRWHATGLNGNSGSCGSNCLTDYWTSGRNFKVPGWALISTVTNGAPGAWLNVDTGTSVATGTPLQDEIIAFCLGPDSASCPVPVYRLAHVQSLRNGANAPNNAYRNEPHAVWGSADGAVTPIQIVFASNWRYTGSDPYPAETQNAYLLNIPLTLASDTCSITAPTAGATVSGATVTVSATGTAGQGAMNAYQGLMDGASTNMPSSSSTSLSATFDSTKFANGAHNVSCTCGDSGGGTGSCPQVAITINNPTPITQQIKGLSLGGMVIK